jgi:hypothetical protein
MPSDLLVSSFLGLAEQLGGHLYTTGKESVLRSRKRAVSLVCCNTGKIRSLSWNSTLRRNFQYLNSECGKIVLLFMYYKIIKGTSNNMLLK